MPTTASPATPKPITVPPLKLTFRACAKLVRAACVVRTLALVATLMPIQPARALKNAPIRKATAITQSLCSTKELLQANKPAATTAYTPNTFHSAFKKALAPLAM